MLCRRPGDAEAGEASRRSANSAEPARPAGWIMPSSLSCPLGADVPPSNHFASGKALDSRQVGGGRRGRGVVVIVVAAVVRHWQHLWRYVKNCRMQSKNKKKAKPNNAQQTESS